ncbi:MAG: dTDP-4-dehydrorhamnose 3,5-epimerase family protein [Saprospiraceae bacterium]
MTVQKTNIEGVNIIKNFIAHDVRGVFVKTFHEDIFAQNGLETQFKESYYSTSQKNVIRGMHFQLPPYDHDKLIFVTEGEIIDVVLDIRTESETYGQFVTFKISQLSDSIFIPKGCAHGFLTISEKATVVYNVSKVYNAQFDTGILWNSFGYDWCDVQSPILSKRDSEFTPLCNFISPFR